MVSLSHRTRSGTVLPDWQLHHPRDSAGWVGRQRNRQIAGNAACAVILRHIWKYRTSN